MQVREPFAWNIQVGHRTCPDEVAPMLRRALRGPHRCDRAAPGFLLPHQHEAFFRLTGIIDRFGGGCLCDTVGLGKTYVALAVATCFQRTAVVVPTTLTHQWESAATHTGVNITIETHEGLSRGRVLQRNHDLIVIDEAHRFRNTRTRRYQRLACSVYTSAVLLLSATPIVNAPRDLLHLIRLFLPDHALSPFGIRSLERALGSRLRRGTLKAVTPLLVARSPRSAGLAPDLLPETTDAPVISRTPVGHDLLVTIASHLDRMTFPSFSGPLVSRLLRAHLWYRLHSSLPAFRSTLERHRAYLDRAIAAATRGERLGRREARLLFDPGDPQLDLDLVYGESVADIDASALQKERDRITQLTHAVDAAAGTNPKLDALTSYLCHRRAEKTIVFVCAVPTAYEIAEALSWNRVAVVSGGQARIASGPLSLDDALRLFAPSDTVSTSEQQRLTVNVLVTTDVLSEGVNLQRANAVVHYDMPWTPLRLQQRIGRICRLGSPFDQVSIRWFVPTPFLEKRLGLLGRLEDKLQHQMKLGVAVSSTIGRAQVGNRALESREHLMKNGPMATGEIAPCFTVVHGVRAAAYAVRWSYGSGSVRDVLMVRGEGEVVSNLTDMCNVLRRLLVGRVSSAPIPEELHLTALRVIRWRLADSLAGPCHGQMRRFARSIVSVARQQRGRSRPELLNGLDTILTRLQQGTRVGGELELAQLLNTRCDEPDLQRWIRDWNGQSIKVEGVTVEAVIFGDGSL